MQKHLGLRIDIDLRHLVPLPPLIAFDLPRFAPVPSQTSFPYPRGHNSEVGFKKFGPRAFIS
jgi:hypothetical protein